MRAPTLIACLAAAGALLGTAPAAHAACGTSTPASTTFADARADAGTAPELTDVTVALDAACRFSVNPGISVFSEDGVVLTFIDRDGNAATGSPDFNGSDVAVATFGFGGAPLLAVWDGEDLVFTDEIADGTTPTPGGFSVGVDQLAIEPGVTAAVRVVSMLFTEDDEEFSSTGPPNRPRPRASGCSPATRAPRSFRSCPRLRWTLGPRRRRRPGRRCSRRPPPRARCPRSRAGRAAPPGTASWHEAANRPRP